MKEKSGIGTNAEWHAGGVWPPPPGITVLPEIEPDPERVIASFERLKNFCKPSEVKIIDVIIRQMQREI